MAREDTDNQRDMTKEADETRAVLGRCVSKIHMIARNRAGYLLSSVSVSSFLTGLPIFGYHDSQSQQVLNADIKRKTYGEK